MNLKVFQRLELMYLMLKSGGRHLHQVSVAVMLLLNARGILASAVLEDLRREHHHRSDQTLALDLVKIYCS
jgi:hypothetical protein